jgi:tetratricopeptide (TPR) repeat protein
VFDSERRLRHIPFFEAIAGSEEGSAECQTATAGLVVLRLVDAWISDGPRVIRDDEWGLRAVRNAIDGIESHEQIRAVLSNITTLVESSSTVDMGLLAPRLMAYGQLLEYDSRWTLANDVYETIVAHTHPVQEADLATQAHLRRGFCLRLLGDVRASLIAYETAGEIASAANDMVGVLRARIGEAKGAIARGNMPRATEILDATISSAAAHRLDAVHSLALHDRSDVAFQTGEYELAIKLAYEALRMADSSRGRDRILGDIAASFYHLGVHSAARDAYLILAATAQEQYQRWMATLNLMEIAAVDGEEILFEQYRRSIDLRTLPPRLEVFYWMQAGVGYGYLGQYEQGRSFIQRALAVAEGYELYKMAHEAEEALRHLARQEAGAKRENTQYDVVPEIEEVANVLRTRRLEMNT